jgi:hypothetical protein
VLSPVVVQLQDNNGNAITGSTAQVTISSTPSGVSGTVTANAVNGVATFSNLVFNSTGTLIAPVFLNQLECRLRPGSRAGETVLVNTLVHGLLLIQSDRGWLRTVLYYLHETEVFRLPQASSFMMVCMNRLLQQLHQQICLR